MKYFMTIIDGNIFFVEKSEDINMPRMRAEAFTNFDKEFLIVELTADESLKLLKQINKRNKEFIGIK